MRILHTADWHLGKMLEGRDRQSEQEQFVDEICGIAQNERVDIVLIAGDVFQSPNPSAAAEDLFYDAIDRLSDHGRRSVVVIAGNHDNPERLTAPSPLAERLGITLVGLPAEEIKKSARTRPDRAFRKNSGASWLEVAVPGQDHTALILALPYPSEGRLKKLLAMTMEDEAIRKGYNECLTDLFGQLKNHFRTDTVNIAMSHLYVAGGIESGPESENPIQMGGAYSVEPSVFDIGAQYLALGHLHRPQKVAGCGAFARYSGSPLAYSFSETGHAKSVVVADIIPGSPAVIREVHLCASHPLVRWKALGGLEEVHRWIEERKDSNAWIDLELHVEELLKPADIHRLRELRPFIVNIRPAFNGQESSGLEEERIADLSMEEIFVRFFQRQHGVAPEPELVKLFLELADETERDEEAAEDETH